MALALSGATEARAFDGPMCAPADTSPYAESASSETHARVSMVPSWLAGEASPPHPAAEGASVLACLPGPLAYTGSTTPTAAPPAAAPETARHAYRALREHRDAGRIEEARVALATLRALVPELSDRWDLVEGELHPVERRGCEAFERAIASPHSAVAARARVGHARCLLEVGDRHAESTLRALLARYPELPEALELRLLEARAREARGDVRGAIAVHREIDLRHPDTAAAARAREELARLAAAGHSVPALTPVEVVARLDVLVRRGAPDFARAELERVSAMDLPRAQQLEVMSLAARMARVEGRFEEAAAIEQRARAGAAGEGTAAASEHDGADAARAELARLVGRSRTLRRVPTTRLFGYLRTAARAGLRAEVDAALDEVASRELPCGLRLDAGVIATGTGDDERVVRVLDGCVAAPGSVGIASRYHRARALERLGRADEARAELEVVLEQDRAGTRWYALWAQQRLLALATDRTPVAASVQLEGKRGEPRAIRTLGDAGTGGAAPIVLLRGDERGHELAPAAVPSGPADVPNVTRTPSGNVADGIPPASRWAPMPQAEIERHLSELAAAHGEAYPWIARALAMVRLGDTDAATDELHEAFLAWHQARGRGTLRAGLEAVYRGATPPPTRGESRELRRARRALGGADAATLGDIAASLGDHGLGIRFGGRQRVQALPRAYEPIVNEAARQHGLDPNLLLAVMRVESVYNPRIVSYAGAVGLLQIMPRTGRLIARSMGREAEFGVDDLLDPRTNIEFAAWYLASLIRRFEGRVPLAVAAYNGGPHNVRRWIAEHSDRMPIDAFCERIPFTQTHRYVRRVLGHWQAYRAQAGLPMVELDPTIPELDVDHVAF